MVSPNDRHLVRLYRYSVGGLSGVQWPDGGALLDQPVKLVQGFGVIGAALERYKQEKKA